MNATTIRTLMTANADGSDVRELSVVREADGNIYLREAPEGEEASLTLLADDSDTSVADVLRDGGCEIVTAYTYRTDAGLGVLYAADFDSAKARLDAMVDSEATADGAWGWVDDVDGCRYSIGECA